MGEQRSFLDRYNVEKVNTMNEGNANGVFPWKKGAGGWGGGGGANRIIG